MFFSKEKTFIYFLFLINNFIFQEITAQIVGGVDATIAELPFIVSLRLMNEHFCGGSIISPRHILTSAHCLFHRQHQIIGIGVVTGSSRPSGLDGVTHRVPHITIHPGFTDRPADQLHHDIAVMTLFSNINFNRFSQKINLPSRNSRPGESVTMSGWGSLSESSHQPASILQRALATVIENPACSVELRPAYAGPVKPGQICAFQRQGVGTCVKDSGGPLSANNEIIGVASFGIPCARGFPDVFTRVFAYKSWIERVMAS